MLCRFVKKEWCAVNKSISADRIKSLAVLLLAGTAVLLMSLQLSVIRAAASSQTPVFSDGEAVAEGEYVCGCCHSHSHGENIFGKFSCFFCRVTLFFREAFDDGERDIRHKYVLTDEISATCVNSGYAEYVCGVCGKKEEIFTPKLFHQTEKIPDKKPGCTENGTKNGFMCRLCGEILIAPETVYASGHNFGEYISDNNADCERDGTLTSTCSRCGETRSVTENGTKKEHSVYSVGYKAPDCENAGHYPYEKCDNCSYTTYVEIPPTGHSIVTIRGYDADCENDGLTDSTYCRVCEKTFSYHQKIEATGHDFADGDTVERLTVSSSPADIVTADYKCCKCSTLIRNGEISAAAGADGYKRVYHTLEKALEEEKNTNVYLLRDYTLKEDIVIKNGITLVIPCMAGDVGYTLREDDGFYSKYCPDNMSLYPGKILFRVFDVPEGRKIRVESSGTLLINAVTGLNGGGQPYSYGVSGSYAEMRLAGIIDVKNGGVFDCSGYTTDNGGEVRLADGALMLETYGILHWRGGSYAFAAKAKKIFPIDGYEMNYMRATLRMSAGARYLGSCKMVAGDSYYYCHFRLAGAEEGYLYRLESGARMEKDVEKTDGRTVFRFYGDVTVSSSSIDIGLTNFRTSSFETYKVDSNTRMEFYDGTVTVKQKIQYMPGSVMVVGKGAVLDITGNAITKGKIVFCTAEDYIYDGVTYAGYCSIDSRFIGAVGVHCRNDLGDAALYVVDGGRVNVGGYGAALAGKVYTDGESYVTFNEDSDKSVSIKVAVGEVKGSSLLAAVSTEKYTIPYVQLCTE